MLLYNRLLDYLVHLQASFRCMGRMGIGLWCFLFWMQGVLLAICLLAVRLSEWIATSTLTTWCLPVMTLCLERSVFHTRGVEAGLLFWPLCDMWILSDRYVARAADCMGANKGESCWKNEASSEWHHYHWSVSAPVRISSCVHLSQVYCDRFAVYVSLRPPMSSLHHYNFGCVYRSW